MARKRRHTRRKRTFRRRRLFGRGKAGTAIKRAVKSLGQTVMKHRGAINSAIKKSGVIGNAANAVASRYAAFTPVASMINQRGYGFYPKGRGLRLP